MHVRHLFGLVCLALIAACKPSSGAPVQQPVANTTTDPESTEADPPGKDGSGAASLSDDVDCSALPKVKTLADSTCVDEITNHEFGSGGFSWNGREGFAPTCLYLVASKITQNRPGLGTLVIGEAKDISHEHFAVYLRGDEPFALNERIPIVDITFDANTVSMSGAVGGVAVLPEAGSYVEIVSGGDLQTPVEMRLFLKLFDFGAKDGENKHPVAKACLKF